MARKWAICVLIFGVLLFASFIQYQTLWIKTKPVYQLRIRNVSFQDIISETDNEMTITPGPDEFEKIANAEMFVRNAYYDNRGFTPPDAIILILAITPKDYPQVYCHVATGANHTKQYRTPAVVTYEPIRIAPYCLYLTAIIECAWSNHVKPAYVSVSASPNEVTNSWHVVHVPAYKPPPTPSYAICLSTIFDKTEADFVSVLEWFELQRMLGVDNVILYGKSNISASVDALLQYYIQTGFLIYYDWKLPLPTYTKNLYWYGSEKDPIVKATLITDTWVSCVTYHAQHLAYMDCLYKHMDLYSHLIYLDLDEFIVPQMAMSIPDMFIQINSSFNSPNIVSFSFMETCFPGDMSRLFLSQFNKSTLFHLTYNSITHNHMIAPLFTSMFLSSRFYRYKDDYGWHHKSIIVPTLVKGANVHEPHMTLPGLDNLVVVDPGIGRLYHYRSPARECGITDSSWTLDTTMKKFHMALAANMVELFYLKQNVTTTTARSTTVPAFIEP